MQLQVVSQTHLTPKFIINTYSSQHWPGQFHRDSWQTRLPYLCNQGQELILHMLNRLLTFANANQYD